MAGHGRVYGARKSSVAGAGGSKDSVVVQHARDELEVNASRGRSELVIDLGAHRKAARSDVENATNVTGFRDILRANFVPKGPVLIHLESVREIDDRGRALVSVLDAVLWPSKQSVTEEFVDVERAIGTGWVSPEGRNRLDDVALGDFDLDATFLENVMGLVRSERDGVAVRVVVDAFGHGSLRDLYIGFHSCHVALDDREA